MPPPTIEDTKPGFNRVKSPTKKPETRTARISTLEIAIRTQAKRFAAHPLVVQHLEAIWAGTIIFHSAIDGLHRPLMHSPLNRSQIYGAARVRAMDKSQPVQQRNHEALVTTTMRRSVTLYNPQEASIFKLSRLRVPRYRQFLSTCSLAVLLGLFVAVLAQRSLDITGLEVVFWFWSAGFMLDEIVGFNEQGFSLYIMSFWNAFDLGILLLLLCFYSMRLYGVLVSDAHRHTVAHMAYDVLAANAVLLFPRLFSVLDHYRYFSQLLIAFRMMAMDLVAVLILIVISCSGFFVAFTLSFGEDGFDAAGVAYALFQMVMGFSPAAWAFWEKYNLLGRAILTLFLFITHFLVITILITVLTNSFMAIVQNANEEHQFVFAVNTISMVKSDALFPYIAPTNIIGWVLTPLRYFLPLRQFVRFNRTVIKVTHIPVLLTIYIFERVILRKATFQPTHLFERHGSFSPKGLGFNAPGATIDLVSPKRTRLREPSIAATQKDRALEEVFRRPFKNSTLPDNLKRTERRNTSNVVNNWMREVSPSGLLSPAVEQEPSTVEKLEDSRPSLRSLRISHRRAGEDDRHFAGVMRSATSDPEDFAGDAYARKTYLYRQESRLPSSNLGILQEQTDGDRDDEFVATDDEEDSTLALRATNTECMGCEESGNETELGHHPQQASVGNCGGPIHPGPIGQAGWARHVLPSLGPQGGEAKILEPAKQGHTRNDSSKTIIYNPKPHMAKPPSSRNRIQTTAKRSDVNAGHGSCALSPSPTRPPSKRQGADATRARPIMPLRSAIRSAPDLAGMLGSRSDARLQQRSLLAMDLGSDIGDNKAMGGGFVGAVPASFTTQMAMATGGMRLGFDTATGVDDQRMMSRLMLARLNILEEGFREVLKEVKDWRREERSTFSKERSTVTKRRPKSTKRMTDTMSDKHRSPTQDKDWTDLPEIFQGNRGSSI